MSDIESLADILKEIATTLQIERPLAVVDVETTGTWPKHDRIVQIAFATVQPNLSICRGRYVNQSRDADPRRSDEHSWYQR